MKRLHATIAALALATVTSGTTVAAEPPSAGRVLTENALGFVHIRVADLWASDVAAQFRQFSAQAGVDLLGAIEKRFTPAPSAIESVTVIVTSLDFEDVLPSGRPTDVTPLWVVTTKQPYDRVALLKAMGNDAQTRKAGSASYIFEDANWSGLYLLDDRTFVYGSEDAIVNLLKSIAAGGAPRFPLRELLDTEGDKHPLTIGINVAALMTPEILRDIPDDLHPLMKAKTWYGTLDLTGGPRLSVAAKFATDAEAAEGVKAAKSAIALGRKYVGMGIDFLETRAKGDGKPAPIGKFPEIAGLVLAAAGLRQVDGVMGGLTVAAKGTTVQTSQSLDGFFAGGSTAVAAGVALSIIYSMVNDRYGGTPKQTLEKYDIDSRERNMRQVTEAIDRYRAAKGHYPPPYTTDASGRPLLSWRVEILPYLEYAYIQAPAHTVPKGQYKSIEAKEFYKLFKQDEPWDGPNNKKLIESLPEVYRSPYYIVPYSARGKTTLTTVVGKGAIFYPTAKVTLTDVTDGTSNTLLVLLHEDASKAVHWTKPADIRLTADGKWPADGPKLGGRLQIGFASGGSRIFDTGLREKAMLALVSRAGGEVIDAKEYLPLKKDLPGKAP